MANETCNVIRYDDTEYDLNDKEDVVELFNDLIYTIKCLRYKIEDLKRTVDYMSPRVVYKRNYEDY